MPYIKMAVPLGISTSEILVAVPTLPEEETLVNYILEHSGEEFIGLNTTRGEVTLYIKSDLPYTANEGTSVIKIQGAKPLRSQNKTFPMLIFRLFK